MNYNRNTGKLRGFTLIEVLVAMVLMSAVLMFSFSILQNIQRIFIEFKRNQDMSLSFARFTNMMDELVFQCDTIKLLSEQKVSACHGERRVQIEFLPSCIVRKERYVCDTFKMRPHKLDFAFEQLSNVNLKDKLIKGLSFEVKISQVFLKYQISKQHDPSMMYALEKEM